MRIKASRVVLLCLFTACVPAVQGAAGVLVRLSRFELPGVSGRIDHLALDASGQRLFVAALGNNSLEVLDLKTGKATSLKGFQEPQGVVYLDQTKQVFVTNGGGDSGVFLDAGNLKVVRTVPIGPDPDNVRYDPTAKVLVVGYGSALAFLGLSGEKLGEVRLSGHPESFQLEAGGERIFVNVPSAGHIAVVDAVRRTVLATWPTPGVSQNFPMALDPSAGRIFVGARFPTKLLVMEVATGKVTASLDCIGDADDVFYDPARQRVYVAGGAGAVSVFGIKEGQWIELARVATQRGARTALYDGKSKLYVAAPRLSNAPAAIEVLEVQP